MWAKWKWLFEFIASTDKHEKAPDFYNKVLMIEMVAIQIINGS